MMTKSCGQRVAALVASLLLLAVGCDNRVDPDFVPPSGALHPFSETEAHGAYLAAQGYDFTECTACHGEDLAGQNTGPGGSALRSCLNCHRPDDHKVMFTNAPAEHAAYLRAQKWHLSECLVCHHTYGEPEGISFGGSCASSSCHSPTAKGPEACNTCHGAFSGDPADPNDWAPPGDLLGNTATTVPGVGAHHAHLTASSGAARPVACGSCHHVPAEWNSRAHIDEDPTAVDIAWGFPANAGGARPHYDREAWTCSATYCHGDAEPVWTQVDGRWSGCGSCHGLPPPLPHPHATLTECVMCHSSVIDATGTIFASELHVNGSIDVSF